MIRIVNKIKTNKDNETLYHIYINEKFIADFWHKRKDGLSICLEKAAIAADNAKMLEFAKLLSNSY